MNNEFIKDSVDIEAFDAASVKAVCEELGIPYQKFCLEYIKVKSAKLGFSVVSEKETTDGFKLTIDTSKTGQAISLIELIEHAAHDETEDDEVIYEAVFAVFSHRLMPMLKELGIHFEYCDPDTSYSEDVAALVGALGDLKKKLSGKRRLLGKETP